MSKEKEETVESVLKHIITICDIYAASTDKVERIELYAKFELKKIKEKKTQCKNPGQTIQKSGKRIAK